MKQLIFRVFTLALVMNIQIHAQNFNPFGLNLFNQILNSNGNPTQDIFGQSLAQQFQGIFASMITYFNSASIIVSTSTEASITTPSITTTNNITTTTDTTTANTTTATATSTSTTTTTTTDTTTTNTTTAPATSTSTTTTTTTDTTTTNTTTAPATSTSTTTTTTTTTDTTTASTTTSTTISISCLPESHHVFKNNLYASCICVNGSETCKVPNGGQLLNSLPSGPIKIALVWNDTADLNLIVTNEISIMTASSNSETVLTSGDRNANSSDKIEWIVLTSPPSTSQRYNVYIQSLGPISIVPFSIIINLDSSVETDISSEIGNGLRLLYFDFSYPFINVTPY